MINPELDTASITADFHQLFYNHFERTWEQMHWLGTKVLKCPMDLWIYQELLFRVRPDLVIETGTAHGGSALFIASIMDLLDHGRVLTVDVCGAELYPRRPTHERIEYLLGSSVDRSTIESIWRQAEGTVLVILDSDHRQHHVAIELDMYADLVSPGSYLIVEDTNVNGHPVVPEHGPGPMEALEAFLPGHPEFEVDQECEKFYLTFNPKGYLRRR